MESAMPIEASAVSIAGKIYLVKSYRDIPRVQEAVKQGQALAFGQVFASKPAPAVLNPVSKPERHHSI
jgi:hypothetical protein